MAWSTTRVRTAVFVLSAMLVACGGDDDEDAGPAVAMCSDCSGSPEITLEPGLALLTRDDAWRITIVDAQPLRAGENTVQVEVEQLFNSPEPVAHTITAYMMDCAGEAQAHHRIEAQDGIFHIPLDLDAGHWEINFAVDTGGQLYYSEFGACVPE